MCLADRVLVYGDCAVNPNPTAEQLADIAISSAATAAQFGIEPRVAMLSYSTGRVGLGRRGRAGARGDRAGARARRPSCRVEGPIQYDAAVDAGVARDQAARTATVAGPRDGLHLPRPQHRQQHLQGRAALAPTRSRSARCCRGSTSRSTTSRAARPCTTSSTRSRSRRSRPACERLRRQLRLVVAEVVGGRRRLGRDARLPGTVAEGRRPRGGARARCSTVAPLDARRGGRAPRRPRRRALLARRC